MVEAFSLRDFEELARARMDPAQFAYYAAGNADEVTLRENEAAFARRRLRPRVLVDVSALDTSTTLLGQAVAYPFGIAPTGQQGFAHEEGECATARAAGAAGIMFCASTSSTRTLEEIAESCRGPAWFQLYTQDNTGPRTEALVKRAVGAGYQAIVLTVDLAMSGRRDREWRAGFDPSMFRPGNFPEPHADDVPLRFTWRDLAWLRSVAGLPIVLKGIMTAEDAKLAVEHGADAVWVSNHGGRQLDRSLASIDALGEVVDAVAGRAEVYMDGGVRRGGDVITALALGARAVFIGRPVLYALASGGEAGVTRAIHLLADEVRYVMALLGTPRPWDITRTHVV
jgi:isopentenyl diphosphate isomerase/L-lactate dehydrogenase-like FMN-dependent dehydrogenase